MWDNPRVMNVLASLLYLFAGALFAYVLFYVVVRLPYFPLRQIVILGAPQHVTVEQVRLIASRQLRGNFFTLDLIGVEQAFRKLPWVRGVTLRRHWPNQLEVTVEEHQALARWNNRALVNTYGEIFAAASSAPLPVFRGADPDARDIAIGYAVFAKILAPLDLKLGEVSLNPRHAWQIALAQGTVIELGRRDVQARLQKFVAVYPQTLGRLKFNVEYVDLRYPNGFAVRAPAGIQPVETRTNKEQA